MPSKYNAVLPCFKSIPGLMHSQAVTHFLEHTYHKDSVPRSKGHSTPKYSAWVFSNEDWRAMGLVVDVLKVLFFLSFFLISDIILGC